MNPSSPHDRSRIRRGSRCYGDARQRLALTLIELMVVLAVISVLAGIALPTVKNSLREQKVKRGASLVQAFIEDARARSIASGGGGGVIIDRSGASTLIERAQATRLRIAKTPPPYTGDSGLTNTTMLIRQVAATAPLPPNSTMLDEISLWFDPTTAQMQRSADDIAAGITPTLINLGDTVLVGEAGLPTRITELHRATIADITRFDAMGTPGVFPRTIAPGVLGGWTVAVVKRIEPNADLRRFHRQTTTFLVSRQPRPAIAMPADLPAGTAIDLTVSGIGRQGNEFSPMEISGNYIDPTATDAPTDPLNPFSDLDAAVPNRYDYESLWIMFGPRGEVSQVFVSTPVLTGGTLVPVLQPFDVAGDIHLLVGRAGQVKVLPRDHLEDDDPDPFKDEASDGVTPLLDADSVWVTIKSRSGEVLATPWTQPLIDPIPSPLNHLTHRTRLRNVIGRAREIAVQSRDGGSL